MLYETLRAIARFPGIQHLRRARYRRNFFSRRAKARFWGIYGTREDAISEATRQFGKADYDEPSIVNNSINVFMAVNLFDWPALFYLNKAIQENGARSIVDVGGHIGVKYYAFRSLLNFPTDFRWQVVEVPSMVRVGRDRRTELGAGEELTFHERPEDVNAADVLFCSGSLQYLPTDLAGLTESLRRPRTIILNKVPQAAGDGGFYTVENLGRARVPYRVFARGELEAQLAQLGYREHARWDLPDRAFSIPFAGSNGKASVCGMVWSVR